jgi:hypothetical protein
MKPYQALIQHWSVEGLTISPGISEEALQDFESKQRVSFPADFREYLANVNGMAPIGGQDSDGKGFAFWPLNRIRPVPEECAAGRIRVPTFGGVESYFAFADYMQWSWAYAISLQLSQSGKILQFGTHSPTVIAGSFTEFVEAYLRDSKQLYVPQI